MVTISISYQSERGSGSTARDADFLLSRARRADPVRSGTGVLCPGTLVSGRRERVQRRRSRHHLQRKAGTGKASPGRAQTSPVEHLELIGAPRPVSLRLMMFAMRRAAPRPGTTSSPDALCRRVAADERWGVDCSAELLRRASFKRHARGQALPVSPGCYATLCGLRFYRRRRDIHG